LAALGLAACATGILAAAGMEAAAGSLLLALALLLVAAAVAFWSRLRLLALAGFALALYPTGVSWMEGLRTVAPDVGARSFLLLVPLIGLPMTVLSLRRPNPVHLSIAFVCGAAAGLWWVVVHAARAPIDILSDALLCLGFLLAAFCLSSRWREDATGNDAIHPEQAS
jgi:hypothetical protein